MEQRLILFLTLLMLAVVVKEDVAPLRLLSV